MGKHRRNHEKRREGAGVVIKRLEWMAGVGVKAITTAQSLKQFRGRAILSLADPNVGAPQHRVVYL